MVEQDALKDHVFLGWSPVATIPMVDRMTFQNHHLNKREIQAAIEKGSDLFGEHKSCYKKIDDVEFSSRLSGIFVFKISIQRDIDSSELIRNIAKSISDRIKTTKLRHRHFYHSFPPFDSATSGGRKRPKDPESRIKSLLHVAPVKIDISASTKRIEKLEICKSPEWIVRNLGIESLDAVVVDSLTTTFAQNFSDLLSERPLSNSQDQYRLASLVKRLRHTKLQDKIIKAYAENKEQQTTQRRMQRVFLVFYVLLSMFALFYDPGCKDWETCKQIQVEGPLYISNYFFRLLGIIYITLHYPLTHLVAWINYCGISVSPPEMILIVIFVLYTFFEYAAFVYHNWHIRALELSKGFLETLEPYNRVLLIEYSKSNSLERINSAAVGTDNYQGMTTSISGLLDSEKSNLSIHVSRIATRFGLGALLAALVVLN